MELYCTEEALAHLRRRDAALGAVIDAVGPLRRAAEADVFSALVHHIVGQQISSRALETVWGRFLAALGTVDAPSVLAAGEEGLQRLGISGRKAGYICDTARQVQSGGLDLDELARLPDEAALRALTALRGVGQWTAEMVLLFGLRRPDVLSFGDFGIRRGLCLLHGHETLPRALFDQYRHLYAPCGTAASLYLWHIAANGLPAAPPQPS